jgi:aryl-alcohol dehydrogenase-like predicted oxidoreductase
MTTRRTFLRHSALATAACAFASVNSSSRAEEGAKLPAASTEGMITRKVGLSGEVVPAVGLGTYKALMTDDLEEQTLAPRMEVLKIFYDHGGRLVDTAPSYGNAETVAGLLTTKLGINDKLFIATKVLERGGEADGLRSYQRSLDLLKRQKLDLMQCHNFIGWDTQLKTMRKWKDDGKFRYIGVTHYQDHGHDELERIVKRDKLDFLQVNYNVAERKAAGRLLPTARDLGMGVLINRPFAAGELLKSAQAKPLPDFVKPWASSWAQALCKFALAHDAVTCILPATSKPEHMKDNIQSGFGRLPNQRECDQLVALFA